MNGWNALKKTGKKVFLQGTLVRTFKFYMYIM